MNNIEKFKRSSKFILQLKRGHVKHIRKGK
jgi:hypothetical protein